VILIDTSLLADHFRATDPVVARLLEEGDALCHPFVIGEIMMENPRNRREISELLNRLPQVQVALDSEVLNFVERHGLFGTGLGYIDAHLLLSVQFTPGATIWTRDRRMAKAAEKLAIYATEVPKLQ
jgi:hypothetical protein